MWISSKLRQNTVQVLQIKIEIEREKIIQIILFFKEKTVLYGIDDDDIEDDSEEERSNLANLAKFKQKKKKAISDYKSAITSIGSRAIGQTSSSKSCFIRPTSAKSGDSRALISENEYATTDNWLIEDMSSRSKPSSAASSSVSSSGRNKELAAFTSGGMRNKRKHISNDRLEELDTLDDVDEDDDRSSDSHKKYVDFDIDDILAIDLNIGEKSSSRKQTSDSSSTLSRPNRDDDLNMDELNGDRGGKTGVTSSKKASRLFGSSMPKKRILDNDVVCVSHVESLPVTTVSSAETRKNPSFTDKENVETRNKI